MPIAITQTTPLAPVPMAKSPEYQKLQQYINETKLALDDISRQLVAIEAKYHATPAPTNQTPLPGQYQSGTGQPVTTAAGAPVMSQQAVQERTSFAKSISEMRRIAGLE